MQFLYTVLSHAMSIYESIVQQAVLKRLSKKLFSDSQAANQSRATSMHISIPEMRRRGAAILLVTLLTRYERHIWTSLVVHGDTTCDTTTINPDHTAEDI